MSGRTAFAAVILAAGESRRMGRPKPLLEFQGETFLGRLTRLFGAHCEQVIVVVGPASRPVATGREACPTSTINPHPERGMLSSLQCGLRTISDSAEAIFFTPVDHPAISESTISTMAERWGGELLTIPRRETRRGHPVLISRALIPEFLELPDTAQARDVVVRHEPDVRYIDVEDPGILIDVDDPAAYRALLESARA